VHSSCLLLVQIQTAARTQILLCFPTPATNGGIFPAPCQSMKLSTAMSATLRQSTQQTVPTRSAPVDRQGVPEAGAEPS